MIKQILPFTFFMLVAVTGRIFAQTPVTGPVFSTESQTIDFGLVPKEGENVQVLHFTNTGTAPLIITGSAASCGCTVPEYPVKAFAPGESGEVTIRFTPTKPGPFEKTVMLTTNEVESRDANHNPLYKTRVITIKGSTLAH